MQEEQEEQDVDMEEEDPDMEANEHGEDNMEAVWATFMSSPPHVPTEEPLEFFFPEILGMQARCSSCR